MEGPPEGRPIAREDGNDKVWHIYRITNRNGDLTVFLRSIVAGEPLGRDVGLARRVLALVRPECDVTAAVRAVVRPVTTKEWRTDRALLAACVDMLAGRRNTRAEGSRAWHRWERVRQEVQRVFVFLMEHGPANMLAVDYPGLGASEDGDSEVFMPLSAHESAMAGCGTMPARACCERAALGMIEEAARVGKLEVLSRPRVREPGEVLSVLTTMYG